MSVTITETINTGGTLDTASKTLSPSDEVLIQGTFSVANSETDKALSIGGVDASQLVAVWLSSNAAVTLETNSGSSADDTIVLAANVPYVWLTGKPDTCLITTDITSTSYATNASGAVATITMRFVQDGTP